MARPIESGRGHNMEATTRTFVGYEISGPPASAVVQLRDDLRDAVEPRDWRWVDPANYHLTSAFLGDVPDSAIGSIAEVLQAVGAQFPPQDLAIGRPGAFANPSRPRVIWADVVGTGRDVLGAVQSALIAALAKIGHPTAVEMSYRPHVTIARARGRPASLASALDAIRSPSESDWSATELTLFASKLGPNDPRYRRLASARFFTPESTLEQSNAVQTPTVAEIERTS